jgi:DNA-binding Lrp family transcriptional regulator
MPKNSKKKITRDRNEFIKQLQKNSNLNINEIAYSCGFSRQKVWRIRNNLENDNTIWGYRAVINDEKLGKKNFVLLIKKTINPLNKKYDEKIQEGNLKTIANQLKITIDSSYYVNGIYDWIIVFSADNIVKAKLFCEYLLKDYQDYISEFQLLEGLFCLQKHGIYNPNKEILKELY